MTRMRAGTLFVHDNDPGDIIAWIILNSPSRAVSLVARRASQDRPPQKPIAGAEFLLLPRHAFPFVVKPPPWW